MIKWDDDRRPYRGCYLHELSVCVAILDERPKPHAARVGASRGPEAMTLDGASPMATTDAQG